MRNQIPSMQRLNEIFTRRPWLLYAVGPLAVVFASCVHIFRYVLFLGDIGVGGLAIFEPMFVLPLIFVDYVCLLCLLTYAVFLQWGMKLLVGLLLVFRLASFYYFLSQDGFVWNLSDFCFRVIIGITPSFLTVLLFSGIVLVYEKRVRLAAQVSALE